MSGEELMPYNHTDFPYKDECNCSSFSSMGDASPQFWECPEHGKTGMVGPMMMIDGQHEVLEIPKDDIWDECVWVIDFCKEAVKPDIFFDEDRWGEVFTPWFKLRQKMDYPDAQAEVEEHPHLLLMELKPTPAPEPPSMEENVHHFHNSVRQLTLAFLEGAAVASFFWWWLG